MNLVKKYTFHFLYTIIFFIILFTLVTIPYYFDVIATNIYQILKLITLLITILISSILLGKKATSKGYLEGVKLGGFVIALFLIITILSNQEIKIKLILYDLIIIITSVLGGMIGINKK